MNIRFAHTTDIPGIIALLQQVGEVHHTIRPDLFRGGAQKYDEAALLELLQDPVRPIFVAVEGENVLGHCFCKREEIREHPIFHDRKELHIEDLCVDDACRGQHIGSALYAYVLDYAKSIGCNYVNLNVWSGNDSAMRFYESRGLRPRKICMEVSLEETEC